MAGSDQAGRVLIAPPGWGFVPGVPIGEVTEQTLPDLPMLRFIENPRQRSRVIVEALEGLPYLSRVTMGMVERRYGLPSGTAYNIITKARTGLSRRQRSAAA